MATIHGARGTSGQTWGRARRLQDKRDLLAGSSLPILHPFPTSWCDEGSSGLGGEFFSRSYSCTRRWCQRQAVATISRKDECSALHASSARALDGSATSSGGSPGRLGFRFTGNEAPVIRRTSSITSRTE